MPKAGYRMKVEIYEELSLINHFEHNENVLKVPEVDKWS